MLEQYRDQVYRCTRCGTCRAKYTTESVNPAFLVCPMREHTGGFEHYFARGMIQIARGILEGDLRYSPALIGALYTCMGCRSCTVHCGMILPDGSWMLEPTEIVRAMRQDIVSLQMEPMVLQEVDENVRKTHNPMGLAAEKRVEWAADLDLPKKGDTVYFAGCYGSYRYPETAKATVGILKKGGLNIAYLGEEEWCCGMTQVWDGNIPSAKEVMVHNWEVLRASGAKKVIASCAECYHVLKTVSPGLLGEKPSFEVLHISEVVSDLLEKGWVKLGQKINKVMTYHDPCFLGRYEKVYDPPRQVLKAIKGATLVEMLRNRVSAWCCGSGGGEVVYRLVPTVAMETAEDRISEAKHAGAEVVVTTCPHCANVLVPAGNEVGIEVRDFSAIVAKAMGLKV